VANSLQASYLTMPIFEEKLICPLSIRFTQQRIRTTFRDGREVEAAIRQIQTRPGVGDYDLILEAPFPQIEVIRWAPNGRKATIGGSDRESWHWFSFDNRRLYCYQRVAATLWPKRVAVPVEILYADMGTIRKKLDSISCGVSVSIGHAFDINPPEWSWRDDIINDPDSEEGAMAVVLADDCKASVDELTDVAIEPSSLTAQSRGLAPQSLATEAPKQLDTDGLCKAILAALDVEGTSSTPTAAEDSVSGSGSGRQTPQGSSSSTGSGRRSDSGSPPDLATALAGTWQGHKGETYTVSCEGSSWNCVRHDGYSTKRFTMIHESDKNIVWWGIQRAYYFSVSELVETPDQLKWFSGRDAKKKRAIFSWYKVSEEEPSKETKSQKNWTHWKNKPSGHDTYASGSQQWHRRDNKPANSKWVVVAKTGGA